MVDFGVLGSWLDSMVSKVISKLKDSMIQWFCDSIIYENGDLKFSTIYLTVFMIQEEGLLFF